MFLKGMKVDLQLPIILMDSWTRYCSLNLNVNSSNCTPCVPVAIVTPMEPYTLKILAINNLNTILEIPKVNSLSH